MLTEYCGQYLLDIQKIRKIDSKKMYETYDNWPEMAFDQYISRTPLLDINAGQHVVFAGMGGSGAISDIFASILSKTNIHVEVVKGYLLPKTVDSESLVIVTSISGNTEETISVLNFAYKKGCKIIAFSDGGKIQKFCQERGIQFRRVNLHHSPRASFTIFLYAMLKELQPVLPIIRNDVNESIKKLRDLKENISSNNITQENHALKLAQWISDIPLIYYPWGLQSAAIRFKNSLQENAKMHAITEDVVEASHNGIVSWIRPSYVKPILVQGKDDYIKTRERWKILKEFFTEKNIEFEEVNSVDGSILSKIICLIYLLDYTSIYKAIMLGIDPTPVEPIDYIKRKLSGNFGNI